MRGRPDSNPTSFNAARPLARLDLFAPIPEFLLVALGVIGPNLAEI